jgi:hypothetical protein
MYKKHQSKFRRPTRSLVGLCVGQLLTILFVTIPSQAGDTKAQVVEPAFAMRCGDLYTPHPYSRAYMEWTSLFVGSPPYPVPGFTMFVNIDRYDTSRTPKQYREVGFNSDSRSGYTGKFQVQATSYYNQGSFQGAVSFNSAGGKPEILPKFDAVICR